jgi:hypothetical protein
MELGAAPPFFLEQIHGGAAGAGCVWLTILGAELVFLDPELRGALPNTPLVMVDSHPFPAIPFFIFFFFFFPLFSFIF